MSPMPKISMSIIKDIIYILSILIAVLFYFRDKAVGKAVLNEQVRTIQSNQNEILKKLQDNDLRWYQQLEQNGKVNMYIILNDR
jgi:hypothetical protein